MQVKPVASPQAVQHAPSTAAARRASAISAFNGAATQAPVAQPPQPIVQNQTSISPEEMNAIQPASRQNVPEVEVIEEQRVADTQPPTPQEDPALSRQFAQLARQEKALRAKAQQQALDLKAREDALAAREAALTKQPSFDPKQYYSKDQLKQDALTVLAEAGVSYEELTQQIISQQPVDPRLQNTISQLKQEIQQLKQANEEAKQSYATNQDQAYKAAVNQIRMDVETLVKSDPNFEAIRATRSTRDVVELIEETYKQDGKLLSVEEAAQEVEDYLIEEASKLAQLNKIKQRLASVAPKVSPAQQHAASQPKQPQPMKTLTNATSSQRQLSAKERAILAFKGELKS